MGDFSFFEKGILQTTPEHTINLEDFVEGLKEENELINQIREETDKDKRNELKKKLSYVTFAGIFEKRNNKSLIESSGLACLDFDEVENIEEMKKELSKDKHTHAVFISPSGNGLKLIVKIPKVKNDDEYKGFWRAIVKHYNQIKTDEGTKDISRACYISHDPKPYFNPDSEVFSESIDEEQTTLTKEDRTKDTSRSGQEMREVCILVGEGLTDEEINQKMMIYSKWSESSNQYKELTIKKAREWTQKEEELNEYVGFGKFGAFVKVDSVVNKIREKYSFATIFGKKNEEIWIYDNGIYRPNGREVIMTEAESLLGSHAKQKPIGEILAKIKRQTAINREEFDKIDLNILPLENGVLNFENNSFMPYDPSFYFKTKIPVRYDKEAECPLWIKFVNETFYEEDIQVIQEWFGFCLYRDYFIKKGLIGVGVGDTGKSVFQNVLMRFFGNENISGLNLQKITMDNNFSKATLYGKYLNLYDDMSSKDINEGGGFKMVTGRSPITAEIKFGDEFQFINYAKMTFCCNRIPPIKDTDDLTYYNRWLPIAFDNQVPETEQDKFLIQKLTTPQELAGILNWALIGLKRLLKNGKFSYSKSVEEIKSLMDRSSHPLAEFVQDCLEESPEPEKTKITKEVMFDFYTLWAKQKGRPRETIEALGRKLPRYASFITPKKDKERYWFGGRFKNTDTYDTIRNTLRGTGLYYGLHKEKKIVSKVSSLDSYGLPQPTDEELKKMGYTSRKEFEEVLNEN